MTSSYQKISGFDRPHVSEMLSDSKISTLESGFKNFRICLRIRRMRVDGSRIRKEKVADSKISGYVWTGPQTVCVCVGVGHALESSESEDLAVVEKRCSSAKDNPKHVYFLFYWQSIIASRARPRVVARSNFRCVICPPSHARGVDFFFAWSRDYVFASCLSTYLA